MLVIPSLPVAIISLCLIDLSSLHPCLLFSVASVTSHLCRISNYSCRALCFHRLVFYLPFLSSLFYLLSGLSHLHCVTSPPYHLPPLLLQKQKYKGQLETMLVQHVVPEFQSQYGYLRARVSHHHHHHHHHQTSNFVIENPLTNVNEISEFFLTFSVFLMVLHVHLLSPPLPFPPLPLRPVGCCTTSVMSSSRPWRVCVT